MSHSVFSARPACPPPAMPACLPCLPRLPHLPCLPGLPCLLTCSLTRSPHSLTTISRCNKMTIPTAALGGRIIIVPQSKLCIPTLQDQHAKNIIAYNNISAVQQHCDILHGMRLFRFGFKSKSHTAREKPQHISTTTLKATLNVNIEKTTTPYSQPKSHKTKTSHPQNHTKSHPKNRPPPKPP